MVLIVRDEKNCDIYVPCRKCDSVRGSHEFAMNEISEKVVDILRRSSDNPAVILTSYRSFTCLQAVMSVADSTEFLAATSLDDYRVSGELNVDLINAVVASRPEIGIP